MSTGSISLDILLNQIREDALAKSDSAMEEICKRYPSLSPREAKEIHTLIIASQSMDYDKASLVVTAPPLFALKSKVTKTVVDSMLNGARQSILITGYSLSDYFSDMIDCIIRKSQQGVFVKFYVNNIGSQKSFDQLYSYRGTSEVRYRLSCPLLL